MGRNLGPLNIKDSYEGLVQISGSQLTDGSGSLIPSLDVSASFATTANTATSASHALNADNAISSSYAVTASFALNAGASTLQEVLDNSNTATGVDIILTGSYQRASGSFSGNVIDNITDTYTGTDKINHVVTLTQAEYNALTPSSDTFYVITDAAATMITGSVTDATLTFTKDDATTFPLTVNNVANAVTAQTASFLPAGTNLNINSITASFASFTSASIGSLRTVTGSAVIIGDEFIILNADTPTARYAGLVVYDSGSGTPATASFEWDGLSDNWIVVEESGNSAVVLTGPTGSKGSEVEPTVDTLQKGGGHHQLIDSNVTDDGSTTKVSNRFRTGASTAAGAYAAAVGGQGTQANNTHAAVIGGFNNNASGIQSFIAGGGLSSVTQQRGAVIGGYTHNVAAEDSVIIGGYDSDVLATHERSVILGGNALATTKADEVVVPHLTISGSTIATDISASGYVSASSFIGDGSQLTGISSDPFPYTGDAEITGSLTVVDGNIVNGTGISDASINIEAIGGANTISLDGANALGSVTIGQSNTSGKRDVVIGIDNSSPEAGNGTRQVVIGHTNVIVAPNFTSENVIVGVDNNISGIGNNNTVIGSNINLDGGSSHVIIGNGMNYDPTGGQGTVLIGGGSNSFTANSNWGVLVGGFGNAVNSNKGGGYGGEANDSNGEYAYFIGGNNNNATGQRSIVLGGSNNTTTAAAPYGAILGGQSNTSGHDRSVVLGGTSLSTTKDDEAVVNHLSIYGDAIVDDGVTTGNVIDNIGQTVVSVEDAVQHIVHCTQAEYDAITPDANTLYVIDGAETLGDTNVDGKLTGTVNTISDSGGTTALDCSVGNYFTLSMPAGGTTVLTPSNITAGQTINIKITQNATAATLTYAASIDFPGGTAFTISTGSGEVDVLTLVSFDGTTLQATGLANFS